MTGNEEIEEELVLKITDRRKYNPDGSLKDGVVIEKDVAAEPVEAGPAGAIVGSSGEAFAESEPPIPTLLESETEADTDNAALSEADEEIPGAEDPASFINFLSTLATNAAASLGAVPHPATGQRSLDLDTGKYWLDVLSMLQEKTKGNLHKQEARLFEGLLADLRMQYVTMVRASEEQLKAQAAQKFSGEDILGRKS